MSGIVGGAGSRSGVIGETEIDYEEGEWAPATSGATISSSDATYTRIGNRVIISCFASQNGEGPSDFIITGLPFALSGSQAAGSVYMRNMENDVPGYISIVNWGGSQFAFRLGGLTGSGNDVGAWTDSGTNWWMSLTYKCA